MDKRRLKVAVYFGDSPLSGGGFSYQMAVLGLLHAYGRESCEFVCFCADEASARIVESHGLETVILPSGARVRLLRGLCRQNWTQTWKGFNRILPSPLDRLFAQHGIELVYFVGMNPIALELKQHNYIFTLFDLCYAEEMEFPEVNFGREFERREAYLQRVLPKATAVIVDSEYGQKLAVEKFGLMKDRVVPLPFLIDSDFLSARGGTDNGEEFMRKHGILRPYVFYPAQFWAHKNHVYILEALSLLRKEHGLSIQLVLSGSDKGNLGSVMECARGLGVAEQVKYVGFVDKAELRLLYQQALALVMPSYFGPTNIPPLEAGALGCPVCYSDKPSFREQMGEGALYMDLGDPCSLVGHLLTLMNDEGGTENLVRHARLKVEQWGPREFWDGLDRIFRKYRRRLACWKN